MLWVLCVLRVVCVWFVAVVVIVVVVVVVGGGGVVVVVIVCSCPVLFVVVC